MMMPSSTSLCWPEFNTANSQAATMLAPGQGSAVERPDAMTGAGLGEIAGECGNHQHGLQSLAEQDDSGLNECRRHEQTRCLARFIVQAPQVKQCRPTQPR